MNTVIHRKGILVQPGRLLAAILLAVLFGSTRAWAADEFVRLYPGVYSERETPLVEQYLADNRAIEERGPVDIRALINGALPKDTPGISYAIPVTEEWVRYNNKKYDPDNRVLNDAAYARKLGYEDILAYPTFGAHDDSFMIPYPGAARDKLLVSQLNHSVTSYRPVYPGDTLYLVHNRRTMTDLTPPQGSTYRSIAIRSEGSVYNQRGEKVNDVVFRVTESLRIYKNPEDAPKVTGLAAFKAMWEGPDWTSRPAHTYSDEDWKKIKRIWSGEKRQGAKPLYWEEVQVGDQPAWTLDGPIEESVSPIPPWGMGAGGSRTLKKEIMDPKIVKTLTRGDDGIYRPADMKVYVPPYPAFSPVQSPIAAPPAEDDAIDSKEIHRKDSDIETTAIHKKTDERAILVNYFGRDLAIRHINNWMGDHGWLYNIRWGIMPPEAMVAAGKQVPRNPDAQIFLDQVPFMKGRRVNVHGLTGDVAIVKSYVYDKYYRDAEAYAELAWWIETIEGDIWLAGGATVKLPSKRR